MSKTDLEYCSSPLEDQLEDLFCPAVGGSVQVKTVLVDRFEVTFTGPSQLYILTLQRHADSFFDDDGYFEVIDFVTADWKDVDAWMQSVPEKSFDLIRSVKQCFPTEYQDGFMSEYAGKTLFFERDFFDAARYAIACSELNAEMERRFPSAAA